MPRINTIAAMYLQQQQQQQQEVPHQEVPHRQPIHLHHQVAWQPLQQPSSIDPTEALSNQHSLIMQPPNPQENITQKDQLLIITSVFKDLKDGGYVLKRLNRQEKKNRS
ncbi:mastermind-like protein 2 [Drosophila kikkawai]|uniref:Mastermind-like protein 2 n=1 Tax=Drosophila kikkawai TaxID=30033 RepID=A0ABM4GHC2_DROKI